MTKRSKLPKTDGIINFIPAFWTKREHSCHQDSSYFSQRTGIERASLLNINLRKNGEHSAQSSHHSPKEPGRKGSTLRLVATSRTGRGEDSAPRYCLKAQEEKGALCASWCTSGCTAVLHTSGWYTQGVTGRVYQGGVYPGCDRCY